jgi:hypothetical protein
MKLRHAAILRRAALAGTDAEPKQPAPKINRGEPRKKSNLYGRVEREVISKS